MLIELGGPRAQPPTAQASPFALSGALPGSSLARPSASAIDALSTDGDGDHSHSGGSSSTNAQESPVGRSGTTHHMVPTTTPESTGSNGRSNGRYAVGIHSSSSPAAAANTPLHSGGLLGTLPGLSAHKSPAKNLNEDHDEEKSGEDGHSDSHGHSSNSQLQEAKAESGLLGSGKKVSPYRHSSSSSSGGGTGRMSAGQANPSARAAAAAAVPAGFPRHLLCGICERPLQDPVRNRSLFLLRLSLLCACFFCSFSFLSR